MERLVLLPFSIGCVSESSVAIGVHQTKRAKTDTNLSASSLSLSNTQTYLHQVYLSHTHTHKIVFTFFFLSFFVLPNLCKLDYLIYVSLSLRRNTRRRRGKLIKHRKYEKFVEVACSFKA